MIAWQLLGWSLHRLMSRISVPLPIFLQVICCKVLNVPVGVICSSWGGSKIESWINKEVYTEKFPEISLSVLTKDPKDIARPKDEPTLLYNAMIHPIKQFTIKGTIWYQGESNLNNPQVYKRLFPAMVRSWRKEWNQGEFPFYYVQIAPYDYGRKNADKTEAAEIAKCNWNV